MKRIVLVGALAAGMLMGAVSGLPVVDKRALVTEVVYVTETVADVIVYVDEDGKPYSTTTEAKLSSAPATTTVLPVSSASSAVPLPPPVSAPVMAESPSSSVPAPSVPPTSAVVNNAPTTSSSAAPTSPKAEAPTSNAAAPPATSAQASPAAPSVPASNSGGDGSFGIGVTYDPYTGSQSSTQCKSHQEIASDFDKMASTFKAVRIYGSDCNLVPLAIQNALKHGLKIMGGAYLTHRGNGEDLGKVIQGYKEAINQNAGGNWDVIQLFSVENERVNDRDFTASEVVDAINRARGQLRGAGYNGPVGAVETVPAMLDNPAICQAADVATVNCHAFFDTNTEAKNAGTFVKGQVERVKSACSGKKVIITESGWPHQGDANGKAVPSIDTQRLAINSIRANFNSDLFIHHAFDSSWKTDWAGSFNAERFWGVIQ